MVVAGVIAPAARLEIAALTAVTLAGFVAPCRPRATQPELVERMVAAEYSVDLDVTGDFEKVEGVTGLVVSYCGVQGSLNDDARHASRHE